MEPTKKLETTYFSFRFESILIVKLLLMCWIVCDRRHKWNALCQDIQVRNWDICVLKHYCYNFQIWALHIHRTTKWKDWRVKGALNSSPLHSFTQQGRIRAKPIYNPCGTDSHKAWDMMCYTAGWTFSLWISKPRKLPITWRLHMTIMAEETLKWHFILRMHFYYSSLSAFK